MTSPASPFVLASHIEQRDLSFRSRMQEMAQDLTDVISLGQGDPDFHTPAHIVQAAHKALDENRHHYTPVAGLPSLRDAIAEKLREEDHIPCRGDHVVITNGVEEAIMTCMVSLLNPGDEVLMGNPRFANYDKAINLCHGRVVSVPTREEDGFVLDPGAVEARITERTRMLILVSPDNPTGAVAPPATVRALAELAKRHNLILISDEIYAGILYDDAQHLSPASLPGMWERTITLNGFSKAYAMTGWRVGYLVGPDEFIRQVMEVRHTLSICAGAIGQHAALEAVSSPREPWWGSIKRDLDRRRALVLSTLDDMGFTYGNPVGGYFMLANITSLGVPSTEFCQRLLLEGRVLVFPGNSASSSLTGEYIRMSYLQPYPRLEEAIRRMRELVADIKTPSA